VVKTNLFLWENLAWRNGGVTASLKSTIIYLLKRQSARSAVLWYRSSFVGPSEEIPTSLQLVGIFPG
jgi:hypothetical protein